MRISVDIGAVEDVGDTLRGAHQVLSLCADYYRIHGDEYSARSVEVCARECRRVQEYLGQLVQRAEGGKR